MDHLRASAQAVEECLDGLSVVASARRDAEALVAMTVTLHAACLERLVELCPDPAVLEADPELTELLWVNRPAPAEEAPLATLAARIDKTLTTLDDAAVPGVKEHTHRLVEIVNELYGWGLSRAVELLDGAGARATLATALADETVASALVVHGLHPHPLAERVALALERAAADLPGLGPSVELTAVNGDVVVLTATGEPARDRWRVAVAAERAVRAVAPDAADVVIEGVEPEEPPATTEAFIPLSSVGRKGRPVPARWIELPELAAVEHGSVTRLTAGDAALLACRVGNDLYVTVDPFQRDDVTIGLALEADGDGPPQVVASTGQRLVLDHPLPVQLDGDRFEVSIP